MIDLDVPDGDIGVLRVRQDGDLNGTPIFFLHGTPGARVLFPPNVAWAKANGVRLLAYDRPGYGGSSPRAGRTMLDAALEVETIAAALGLDRYTVLGYSGGGGPALACAAQSPKRVAAAVAGATLAPFDAVGLEWLATMDEENREDIELLQRDQPAWEERSKRQVLEMLELTPDLIRRNFGPVHGYHDSPEVEEELATFLCESTKEGLRSGIDGIREDALAQIRPWGFDIASIRIPVQIWHGENDRFVPVQHGRWLAAHIPGAESHIEPGLGHPSVFARRGESMLNWLRGHR